MRSRRIPLQARRNTISDRKECQLGPEGISCETINNTYEIVSNLTEYRLKSDGIPSHQRNYTQQEYISDQKKCQLELEGTPSEVRRNSTSDQKEYDRRDQKERMPQTRMNSILFKNEYHRKPYGIILS